MIYPPLWLWLAAFGFIGLGLWLSRRRDNFVARLPGWLAYLLVLGALVGVWYWLNVQFGGQVISVRLP